MRVSPLILLMGSAFAGLTGLPSVTALTTPDQVNQVSPRRKVENEPPQVQREHKRSPSGRKQRLGNTIGRHLNQRQRRKLHRQVPQLRKKCKR